MIKCLLRNGFLKTTAASGAQGQEGCVKQTIFLTMSETFTFEVKIELLQLYDTNGKEIEDGNEQKMQNMGGNSENDNLINVRMIEIIEL